MRFLEQNAGVRNFLILAAFVLLLRAPIGAGQEWVAAGTKNDVALAFRDDAGLDAREVRAVAELPHDPDRIVAVVCDFTQRLDADVREARVISGDLQSEYAVYLRYAPRFMIVAARDVVIDVRRTSHGCAWSEQPGAVPATAGIVRMPLLRGSWNVEPLAPMRSRVTYQIAVKPGGRIPVWLVRRGAASALPGIIKQVEQCLSRTAGLGARCVP